MLRGSRQIGKAQPVSEPVRTPYGWTDMGDIRSGDYVLDGHGNPSMVTGVAEQGTRQVYKLVFSDGAWTRCDLQHLWVAGYDSKPWELLTLETILERGAPWPDVPILLGGCREIESIQPDGYEECRCIAVDSPDHTYVTRFDTVTHNSVTLGTRQRTHAHMFGGFTSLYVAPHSEPLNTYCRKFLDIERGFNFPAPTGDKFKQNLQYKEYTNGSKIEMVRIQTSATPARGKTYDEVAVDECLSPDTYVENRTGVIKVVDIRAGDTILAFDDQLNITTDTVLATKCQGIRHTWRVTTSRGHQLTCTKNEKILSDSGWIYLSSILPSCQPGDRTAGSDYGNACDAFGNLVRGREPDDFLGLRESTLLGNSRPASGSVLPLKIRAAQAAGQHTSETVDQSGLWGNFGSLQYAGERGVELPDPVVFGAQSGPPRQVQEIRDPSLGGSTDVGSGGMVVHGRRVQAGPARGLRNPQFQQGGSGSFSEVVHEAWSQGRGVDDRQEGEVLLDLGDSHGELGAVCEQNPQIHSSDYDVQSGFAPTREVYVYVLRNGFRGETRPNASGPGVLHGPGLRTEEPERGISAVSGEGRAESYLPAEQSQPGEGPGTQEDGTGTEQRASASAVCGPRVPGQPASLEASVSRGAESCGDQRTHQQVTHLRLLPEAVCELGHSLHSQHSSDQVLPGSRVCDQARQCDETDSAGPCGGEAREKMILDQVVWVEYVGEQEVWDIETEKHHTFFANGVAVHNCQLFDPGLETEVLEVLNDSTIKSILYAGTSTTTESLLEVRYQEGTQGVWHIALDNGQTINCGDAEQVMRYVGPYYMQDPVTGTRINPLNGYYKYENPAGFERNIISIHIPQIINPDKANNALEWNGIYKTMIRDPKKFIQEKLGIPVAEANQEVSEQDLRRICVIQDGPEARKAKCRENYYRLVVSGFDWGGSDYNPMTKSKISSTCHVMLGVAPADKVHIIHCRRHAGKDYKTIMNQIVADHRAHAGGGMASDFGGGQQYHMLLRTHPHLDASRHVIFDYSAPETALCFPSKSSTLENMLMLNRTESITALYLAIVMDDPLLLAPSWLEMEDYLRDFMNMNRVLLDKERGHKGRRFVYHRHPSKTDDVVHATNMAYSMLRLSTQQLLIEDPAARMLIRNAVYGGQGSTIRNLNPFASAQSTYARNADDHD